MTSTDIKIRFFTHSPIFWRGFFGNESRYKRLNSKIYNKNHLPHISFIHSDQTFLSKIRHKPHAYTSRKKWICYGKLHLLVTFLFTFDCTSVAYTKFTYLIHFHQFNLFIGADYSLAVFFFAYGRQAVVVVRTMYVRNSYLGCLC